MLFLIKKFRQLKSHNLQEDGFTLIELLVVIIMLGILSSISSITVTKMISKARHTEGITYVKQCQNAQAAYYIEHGEFSESLSKLGLPLQTKYFIYETDILPVNQSENNNEVLACCMGAEKTEDSQMYFLCTGSSDAL